MSNFSENLKVALNATNSTTSSPQPVAATFMMLNDESDAAMTYNLSDEFERVQNSLYLWIPEYEDSNFSFVDNLKNVTVNDKQVNIAQEENSQIIPFELDRFYDGIDLSQMTFRIYYVNSLGQEGLSVPINVTRNSNKIRFCWLVDGSVTAIAGKIDFEIRAEGTISYTSNDKTYSKSYQWKTRPCNGINILESLKGNGAIEPSEGWDTYLKQVSNLVSEANDYAATARQAATDAQNALLAVDEKINDASTTIATDTYTKVITEIESELLKFYTREEVDNLLANIDISSQLNDITLRVDGIETKIDNFDGLANLKIEYDETTNTLTFLNNENIIKSVELNNNPSVEWVTAYDSKVDNKITTATTPIQSDLDSYKTQVNDEFQSIHNTIDSLPSTLESDYYTIAQTDELLKDKASQSSVNELSTTLNSVQVSTNTNKDNIALLGSKITEIESAIGTEQKNQFTYDVDYNEDSIFTLYEIENEGEDTEVKTPKKQFTIKGGSGGSSTSSMLKIEYVTRTPFVVTTNDTAIIKYNFSGTDSSGDTVMEGNYTWKIGNNIIATGTAVSGENSFDATEYLSLGTQKLLLSIADDAGSLVTKAWTVQKVDVKIESSFNDTFKYPMSEVSFDYTPYGAISKTIHFILDGIELSSVTSSASGIPQSYTLPVQSHGSHLLETYITAEINGNFIESNHIFKDIIWWDESSDIPVVSCIYQNITSKQYTANNITYTVYDPKTETPTVSLIADDNVVSTQVLQSNTQVWQYKTSDIGTHLLKIQCRDVVKNINLTTEKLDIDVEPVTANLIFDFNPTGKTNNDVDKLWSYGDISMSVSDNFDWVNGGYQIDNNGDQYFCVKAGTNAIINYNLFADDARKNGKEFKIIFKTTNVRKSNATFLTCMSEDSTQTGLQMNVHEAYIRSSLKALYAPYSEEDIIEFDFNIVKDTDIPIVITYEDGTPYRPMSYTSDHSFTQSSPVPITIGSPDCDVYIYRMKSYSSSLPHKAILTNFIADARNPEEMIARYNRNQIYDENNNLTPDSVAKSHPDIKVIKIDCPHFTNDKKDFVLNTNVECIHINGRSIYDNWKAINAAHSGQGTTSNEYGAAGRNMDLLMCFDGVYKNSKIPFDENYKTTIILGDGTKYENGTGKITLTSNSIPVNILNIKVNVASSEMENNAISQKRYNDYIPYTMPAQKRDSRVKNTMEFVDCVVFVRENDPDISTHREFKDTEWHFYALANIGDSKKTDYTRVNDPNDPKEFVVEIMDNTLPNSTFSGSEEALAALDADQFDEEGTYGFRYEMSGITDEQRQTNMTIWKDFYRFVALASNEEFVSQLKNWFIVDSALYQYLFTERYTMIDNRAKNTFWHFSKVYISQSEAESLGEEAKYYTIDDEAASINNGYRFEFWHYDGDTMLGINNSGELTMTYGKEDIDYRTDGDPSSGYIFNAAESKFFCRIRDLMPNELAAMYQKCESNGCWSSSSLINEYDERQEHFSEELWRINYERLYERTYRNGNTRFLEQMMNGKKKYQRRQFERDQSPYFGTKYFATSVTSDQIMFRCNTPVEAVVKPDYTLHLTPYSDMYLSVMFGATYRTQIRAKAGVEYDISCPFDTMDDTAVLIYCASRIQSMGDISACYIHDNDFSKATRLMKLIIGNSTPGYVNNFLTHFVIGNNTLLELLDIRNTPKLAESVNVSSCNNLEEFYAEGSGITGVVFANGGKLRIAHIPAVISLSIKNLSYLEEFNIDGYDNLRTLIIENTPFIDSMAYANSPNLTNVRLIGIDWNAINTDILDKLIETAGIDNSGYNTDVSVLTGNFYSPVIKQQALRNYNDAWNDLVITYDTLVQQFAATFKNDDGSIIEVQYVDKGGNAVDPTTRETNPIIPTKESTIKEDFEFLSWDSPLTEIFSDRVITATYSSSIREYTIKYNAKGATLYEKKDKYGAVVDYVGDTPTYTYEESAYVYHLFNRWDKSGLIDGDKTVNAIFDRFEYTDGYFNGKDLSTLSPVEIYAMIQLGLESTYVQDMDSVNISIGKDYIYDDIESNTIISEKTVFNGQTHLDTGIQLFDEDRDFVLAIDYKFLDGNSTNSTLAQCFKSNGSNGIKLWYNSGVRFTWGTSSTNITSTNNREVVVIRHKKGDNNLLIYNSNLVNDSPAMVELTRTKTTEANSTLVFGCAKADDGAYENYAIGNIYWAKLWYLDLGDEVCRKLALWTHETIPMEVSGFKKYYLTQNPSKRSSISLLAKYLLDINKTLSPLSSNEGGWANMTLNTYLNNRFYEAFSDQWKLLIKQVTIASSIGNKSNEISTSECYVSIPACIEVDPTMTSEPYINEDKPIAYMTTNDMRKCSRADGDYSPYWLRSPNISYSTYMYQVTNEGNLYGYYYPYNQAGVRIEISI